MNQTFLRKWLAVLLAVVMCLGLLPAGAMAKEGDVPQNHKTVTRNDDGTFTIALDVTGDSEKKVSGANVVVVFDTSSSMNQNTNTSGFYPSNTNGQNMYRYNEEDGSYVRIYRFSEGFGRWTTYYYTLTNDRNGQRYTGQRFIYSQNTTRIQAAKSAVYDLADALLSNNTVEYPNLVQIALVDFANMADVLQEPTSQLSDYQAAINRLSAGQGTSGRGTNWEAGLTEANSISFGDTDKTYVILVSDGNPTFYLNGDGTRAGTGAETSENVEASYKDALEVARDIVDSEVEFYTIGCYGTVDRMKRLTTEAGAAEDHYFSAADSHELQEALNTILAQIEMAGIGAVEIDDGTTSKVTTTSGDISLLTVDESSYKYYRSGGNYNSDENGGLGEEWEGAPEAELTEGHVIWNLEDVGVLENGVTYTVTFNVWPSQTTLDIIADIQNDPGEDGAWGDLDPAIRKYIDVDGKLKTNTMAKLSYFDTRTGTGKTVDFDNPDPVSSTAVEAMTISKKWENELDKQGAEPVILSVLRDGEVHYTVELGKDGTWEHSVAISVGIMSAAADEEGNLTAGKVEVRAGAKGHDFTFQEPEGIAYYWELKIPTVHPMLINGVPTMLVKVEDEDELTAIPGTVTETYTDGTYYKIGDNYYKVDELSNGKLTATNQRKSYLDVTKVVEGSDSGTPEDALFEYSITITNPTKEDVWFSIYDGSGYVMNQAEDGSVADTYIVGKDTTKVTAEIKDLDEDSHISNIRYDGDAKVYTYTWTNDDGTTKEYTVRAADDGTGKEYYTGYYSAVVGEDGAQLTIKLKAGWNLRFLNMPEGATYSVSETKMDEGFFFDTVEGVRTYNNEKDTEIVGEVNPETKTISGTIEYTNSGYKATFTNKYQLTDVVVTKVWDDANDQDGIRPDELPLTLNGLPEGTTAPDPEVTESDDGSTWTYTWSGLPKKDSAGNDLIYTVTETEVPEGYTAESTTASAENDFTITNKHTPETVNIGVTKAWADGNDKHTSDSVTVYIVGKDTTLTLDASKNWTGTFEGLPKYADGEEIAYSVGENDVTGYNADITGNATSGFTVTNSPANGTLTIKKTFEGLTEELIASIKNLTFTVTYPDNTEETISWTDFDDGAYTLKDVPVGNYTVTESGGETVGDYILSKDTSTTTTTATVGSLQEAVAELVNKYVKSGLEVDKVATKKDGQTYALYTKVGDTIEYTITVTNTGNTTLTDIKLEDALMPTADAPDPFTLKPNETKTITYTYKVTDDAMVVKNTATATGEDPSGNDVTDTDTETVYKDAIGGGDDPDKPDGTPDIYQVRVNYIARTGGTVGDPASEVLTLPDGAEKGTVTTVKGNTATASSGYRFVNWTNDFDANTISTAATGNITFTDIAGGKVVNVYANFNRSGGGGGGPRPRPTPIPDEDVPLAPIPDALNGVDHFAYVKGYPDGTVKPEGNVTRAETSTMLYRLLKPTWRDIYFTDQNSFSDVEKALWFNKAVSSMANGEYVNGYPDGTFQGNKSITRAEFVTIMIRFLGEDPIEENPFTDIGNHWAKDYILTAVGAGWIDGYPDGTFQPNALITRAEAMKIINSVLHRGVNETSELGNFINFPDNEAGKWYYYEVLEAVNDHEHEGERPNENWTSNSVDYFYDIVKYEHPGA